MLMYTHGLICQNRRNLTSHDQKNQLHPRQAPGHESTGAAAGLQENANLGSTAVLSISENQSPGPGDPGGGRVGSWQDSPGREGAREPGSENNRTLT